MTAQTKMGLEQDIQQTVLDAIGRNPFMRASSINVDVDRDIVTLRGYAGGNVRKWAAERAALGSPGVRVVVTNLDQAPTRATAWLDTAIAHRVASTIRCLEDVGALGQGRVRAKIDNAHVSLSGSVDHSYQLHGLVRAIELLPGVRGVFPGLAIVPDTHAPSDAQAKRR